MRKLSEFPPYLTDGTCNRGPLGWRPTWARGGNFSYEKAGRMNQFLPVRMHASDVDIYTCTVKSIELNPVSAR